VGILLDTHVFLWYITGDSKLPSAYQSAIQDPVNEVFLSVVSIWESVIKHQLGKLPLPSPPAVYLPRRRNDHGIVALPIDEGAMAPLSGLRPLHRDPFDRLLVAQAIQHELVIASVDPDVMAYPVRILPPT
jgi:PIN domain nuclease of toxin-antitoxin system